MSDCIVNHIVWGRGVIQSSNEKYIKVLFDDPEVGEKTFVYPDAFSKYLAYEDKKCQTEIESRIKKIQKQAEEEVARYEKERLEAINARREHEKNLIAMRKKAMAYSRKRAEKLRVKKN